MAGIYTLLVGLLGGIARELHSVHVYHRLTCMDIGEQLRHFFGSYHPEGTLEQAESASTAKAAATLSFLALVLFIFDIF